MIAGQSVKPTALSADFHSRLHCACRLPASRPAVGVKRRNTTSAGVKAPPAPPPRSPLSHQTAPSLLWDVWSDTSGLPVNWFFPCAGTEGGRGRTGEVLARMDPDAAAALMIWRCDGRTDGHRRPRPSLCEASDVPLASVPRCVSIFLSKPVQSSYVFLFFHTSGVGLQVCPVPRK